LFGELAALLVLGTVIGFLPARRAPSPLRRLVREMKNLTPDRLRDEEPPRIRDHSAQAAVDHLWSIGRGLVAPERDLAAQIRPGSGGTVRPAR